MMNKKIFKKITKHISHSKKGIKIPRILYPEREWANGLIFSFALLVIICTFSVYAYKKFEHPLVEENGTEEVHPIVYRESMVNDALLNFSNKQEEHTRLMEKLSSGMTEGPDIFIYESLNVATSSSAEASNIDPTEDDLGIDVEEVETGTTSELILE